MHTIFKNQILLTAILVFFFVGKSFCQSKTSQSKNDSSYFKAGISFLSNSVYNGRKDSLNLAYITPSLGYYHKSGLSLAASVSYLLSSGGKRIDLFSLDAGYDFDITNNVSASLYASKYFYNKSSTAVQSDAGAAAGSLLTYDPGIVTVSAGADVLFSGGRDFFLTLAAAHNFYIGNEDNQWTIAPTIATNFGSQNYYQGYQKKVRPRLNVTTQPTISNTTKFTLLDYEISLPINYEGKTWGAFLTPTYAIPQNPVTFTTVNGAVLTVEKLENLFYAELGVYIRF